MNRIQTTLGQLAAKNKKALVSYVVAGDPSLDLTLKALFALVESGTDIIELGVPFSDPSAEGPVIQRAHERALDNKVGLRHVFELVREFRKANNDIPIVLMGYANPIEWMGYEAFAKTAAEAGVDGVLTVDIPSEESAPLNKVLTDHGLFNIFLLAPTTTDERVRHIAEMASGFLYYVSLKGVTGSAEIDIDDVKQNLERIRGLCDLPICVGFGIKNAAAAAKVSQVTEGVVVGSAFVNLLNAEGVSAMQQLTNDIRQAMDE